MLDWKEYSALLEAASERAIRRFLGEHPGYDLCAIGFTFELGNESPALYLCANSSRFFAEAKSRYRIQWPDVAEEKLRWSSGDYEYPVALANDVDELGSEWESRYFKLHRHSQSIEGFRDVYNGLVEICCEVLAALASRSVIPNGHQLDFNVAEYGDDIAAVRERHARICSMIAQSRSS